MKMIRAISVLLFLLVGGTVSAADITLNWTNATQNTDGTTIPTDTTDPNSLATTTIYWGACDATDNPVAPLLSQEVPTTVPGAAGSTQVVITTPGRWCFVGTHTNLQGQESDWSGTAIKEVFVIPNPPDNLTVSAETVYYVIQRENRYVLLPVGTVPVGTACIGTEYVNGYYVVPREEVTWSSSTQPLAVVAQCSPQ